MGTTKTLEFVTIPKDWDFALLGRESDPILNLIRNGLTIPQDKNEGDYKITRIETIGDGYIDEGRVRFVSKVSEETLGKFLIRKDDILFSHINSEPHIGKTAIALRDYPNLLHGMNLLLLRPNSEVVDSYFLHLVFRFYRQIGVFSKICARAVNQSSINQEKLRSLEIPLPPLSEQRRIAHVLSTVQTAIEQQERLIALTRELKAALMKKLFTEGLRGEKQKETEIGLVPESWEVVPLKKYCNVLTSSMSYTQLNEFDGAINNSAVEVLGIKVSDMNLPGNENLIFTSNLAKHMPLAIARKKAVPSGTIIFPKRGAAIATNKKRLTTTWTVFDPNLIGVKPKQGLDTGYAYYWLQRFDLRKITDPGPTPQLNKKDLEPLLISVPTDLSEQKEIADSLEIVDKKVELLSTKRSRLEELFRSLLHQLMTAQIRVNDIDLPGLN